METVWWRKWSCVLVDADVTWKPVYVSERHSSQAPLETLPMDSGKRNTAYVGNTPSGMQRIGWSLARNADVNCRHGRAVGSSSAGMSLDRPSHNYATGISETRFGDDWVRGTPQHSGTRSFYQPATAVTGRPVSNSRPRSSITIGTSYRTTATQLPRSHTAAHLPTSSATASYHCYRPLPSDPLPAKSSSRRSLPHTAYRT